MELPSPALELLLLLALSLIPLLSLLYHLCQDAKQQPRAHGLKVYPLVGTLPHFLKNHHRFLEWTTDMMKRDPTHTISVKALGLTGVAITANPANVEHMAKTNFANYPKGELAVSMLEDFLGHGIFNSDGDQWLRQRKAASHEFGKRSLRDLVLGAARSEVAERLLPLLDRACGDGRALDLQDVLERFAFDAICRVAFGDDPACLAEGEPRSAELMRAFDDAQRAVMARFMSPVNSLWRLKRLLGVEPERRMRAALATIHGYAGRIVREHRERRSEAGAACGDDFLSRFAAAGGERVGDESLRDVVTNFLLAGRDTTSSALSWFFWLVSTRPDVEDRIVREVRAVRASGRHHGSTGEASFSFDELRDMHYLHAAVTESMRLYPPVAMDTHGCREDDVLPDGTFIGKGWLISYSAYAMARMEDVWGKDCELFRPERWLGEDGAFRPESPFRYPVFHAGPRMCLGKEMAYIQMKSVVACVLERFSFRYVGGERRPGLVLSLTLRMEGGLSVQVSRRS